MKRRKFLKTVAGIAGAAIVGAKIEAVPTYTRVPRGLPFVVNGATKIYPELKAPVLDAHGGSITFADIDRVMAKLKDDSDKRAQASFDASEAYYRGRLRKRGLY